MLQLGKSAGLEEGCAGGQGSHWTVAPDMMMLMMMTTMTMTWSNSVKTMLFFFSVP